MSSTEAVRLEMFSKITQWQQSGLSQKAYCEQHHLRYHVFHYWYKCYRDEQSIVSEKGFIPLHVPSSAPIPSACMEVVFADGKRLLFHQLVSSDYLKAIIS